MNHAPSIDPLIDEYIAFQSTSSSPFHVVATAATLLNEAGFQTLHVTDSWQLSPGGKYTVVHPDGKTLIAFCQGDQAATEAGFQMIGAHTDSPALRLKLDPWESKEECLVLGTQKHGGLILRSWLDRPLILAGAVYTIKRDQSRPLAGPSGRPQVEQQVVQCHNPIGVIPDLAIHLDRDKNANGELNAETAMLAVTGLGTDLISFKADVCAQLGVKAADLDGFELSLAPYFPHVIAGTRQELILGPRHDDIAMVFCGLQAIIQSSSHQTAGTKVLALFDAEETGSQTTSGAGSLFFRSVLERIVDATTPDTDRQSFPQAMGHSFFVSADMAHAGHPSYESKHDRNHRPRLNGGIVIKENANDAYATSGYSHTYFKAVCEAIEVPVQPFVARQDMGCGSTIGPATATKLGCPVVDVGTAMWGMHSTAETMGTKDIVYAVRAFDAFFRGI